MKSLIFFYFRYTIKNLFLYNNVASEAYKMKDLYYTSEDLQYDIQEVKEIIKCKSPDGNLCIAEGFSKALLDNTSAIICIWSLDGSLVKFNTYGQKITGFTEREVSGIKWERTLFNSSTLAKILPIFQQFRDGIIPEIHETPIQNKNGTSIDVLWTNCIIYDKKQKPYLAVSIGADTTELKRAQKIIEKMGLYDSATGFPNRNLLMREMNAVLIKAEEANSKTAVLFLDLDNFKGFNETYGYSIGDTIIKNVADSIRGFAKDGRIVARLDSDKFIILVPEANCLEQLILLGQDICQKVNTSFYINGKPLYPSASIGISIYPKHGQSSETLLKNANIALAAAKLSGKGQIKAYEPYMENDFREKIEIENDLRSALNNKEFLVYYQPQVDINSGELVGVEALLRWNHPEKGFIPPDKFIPIAEETGLIYEIGNWVLRSACMQNKLWHDKGYKKVKFSINISAKQFERKDFINRVHKKIMDTGISPEWLELEITESIAMIDYNYTVETIKKLKELNISFAIDDFGTGYSSFNYLNKLPVDKLKIDKSFLQELKSGSNEEFIAKAIIGLASHMKLTVVAEGVETASQIAFLREQQCPYVQGYYFSKPLPPEEFEVILKNGAKFKL
jgi:diguanylate cyclase (GGDEF)-like protein/PAS domain S-box-containing protein